MSKSELAKNHAKNESLERRDEQNSGTDPTGKAKSGADGDLPFGPRRTQFLLRQQGKCLDAIMDSDPTTEPEFIRLKNEPRHVHRRRLILEEEDCRIRGQHHS